MALLAGLGHSVLGTIDFTILASLLIGSVPAIIVTSMAAARVSENAIRIALALVLLAVCAKLFFF